MDMASLSGEDLCPICLDLLGSLEPNTQNNQEKFTIECGHIFHKTCILDWIKNIDNCPICRKSLSVLANIQPLARDQNNQETSSDTTQRIRRIRSFQLLEERNRTFPENLRNRIQQFLNVIFNY